MANPIERLLLLEEGLRNTVYRCPAGKLTIGIGRNLEDRGISDAEATYMLRNDIRAFRRELTQMWPWFTRLSSVRQAVLVDMAFNLGVAGLSTFKKMLTATGCGYYSMAAEEMMDSKWAKQVGKRAERLSVMMETDLWPKELSWSGHKTTGG